MFTYTCSFSLTLSFSLRCQCMRTCNSNPLVYAHTLGSQSPQVHSCPLWNYSSMSTRSFISSRAYSCWCLWRSLSSLLDASLRTWWLLPIFLLVFMLMLNRSCLRLCLLVLDYMHHHRFNKFHCSFYGIHVLLYIG